MSVKALVLSGYLGVLCVAVLTWVLVLTTAGGKGGHASVAGFLLCGFIIVFCGFVLCWRQRPQSVAKVACGYLSSLEEGLTMQDGASILRRYSLLLLVAALLYLAGAVFALFLY